MFDDAPMNDKSESLSTTLHGVGSNIISSSPPMVHLSNHNHDSHETGVLLLRMPTTPAKAIFHLPLLDGLVRPQVKKRSQMKSWTHLNETKPIIVPFNLTEGDAIVERFYGASTFSQYCSVWDGIQLCTFPDTTKANLKDFSIKMLHKEESSGTISCALFVLKLNTMDANVEMSKNK